MQRLRSCDNDSDFDCFDSSEWDQPSRYRFARALQVMIMRRRLYRPEPEACLPVAGVFLVYSSARLGSISE